MIGPVGAIPLEVNSEVVDIGAALERGLVVRLVVPPDRDHVFGVLEPAVATQSASGARTAWFVNEHGRKHEYTLPLPLSLMRSEYEPLSSYPDDALLLRVLHSPDTFRSSPDVFACAERRVIHSFAAAGGSESIYRKTVELVWGARGLSYPGAKKLGIADSASSLAATGVIAERRVSIKDPRGIVRGAKILFEKPQLASLHDDYVALKEAALGSGTSLTRLLTARGLDESMRVAIRALADDELSKLNAQIAERCRDGRTTSEQHLPGMPHLYSTEIEGLIADSALQASFASHDRDEVGVALG
ncbi:hypothetical protein [Burkholderia sp. Tr-20390]|uniref:hypothetical protein n=1 Tax=Burkholderia sp. Tr-20390 TaxID=2703904 RepID=UPI00198096BA|nr:hypothetical protein [Burkholderia sp. Tr-20390]MBN3729517.1 hypothetical protein [Burkholderia sp. Tr-20390]